MMKKLFSYKNYAHCKSEEKNLSLYALCKNEGKKTFLYMLFVNFEDKKSCIN